MRPRLLTDEQADELYREYCQWIALNPKKLQAKYKVSRDTMRRYIRERLAA